MSWQALRRTGMTLSEVRVNIDRVDREIKELLKQRMALSEQVVLVKAKNGDAIYKPERELELINKLTEDVDSGIKQEYTAIIKRIMDISRKYQYGRMLELRDCFDIDYCETQPDNTANVLNDFTQGVIISKGKYELNGELIKYLLSHNKYVYYMEKLSFEGRNIKAVSCTDRLTVLDSHNRLYIRILCGADSRRLGIVLTMISDCGVDISDIITVNENGDYSIFAELCCNMKQKEIKSLIFQLECETDGCNILGSYRL